MSQTLHILYFVPVLTDYMFYKLTLFQMGDAYSVLEEGYSLSREHQAQDSQRSTHVHVLGRLAPLDRDEAVQNIKRNLQ